MAAVRAESWRDTCINKWSLKLHESDDTSEDQWQKYYEERNVLEEKHKLFDSWISNQMSTDEISDEDEVDLGCHPMLRDFHFCGFCFDAYDENLDNVVNHLRIMRESLNKFGLTDLGSHLYTLKLYMGEDDSRNPRDIDLRSRLYSPFSSRSLDFKFTYHYRPRLYETEDYHYLQLGLRTAEDIQPNPKAVFTSLPKDSGKWLTFLDAYYEEGHRRGRGVHTRSVVPPVKLRKIQSHIFGKVPAVDEEKAFCNSPLDMCKIVLAASGIELLKVLRTYYSGAWESIEPDNIGWIWKCIRQNFGGGEEESEDSEEESYMIRFSKRQQDPEDD